MENLRPYVYWWNFECQAVASANPNVFGDQMSQKDESAQPRRLLQANNKTALRGLWIIVFHFLVLPNMACPRTLSRIYLGIWFWGNHGVMNIA